MSFLIRGDKTVCATCGEVLASQSWRDKTAHVCSRRRADYDAALSYADAVARLLTRCDTGGLEPNTGAETDRLTGHEAAPITSRGLTAKTSKES